MAGPPPAVAAARLAVRDALADLDPGSRVVVACSGGADSMALAVAAAFVGPRAGLRVASVTVDHGLRPESGAEAEEVVARCRALRMEPALMRRVEPGTEGGPEAGARRARYDALGSAAEELDAVAVLLGHTLDDQAETVLLGLARGSGARSLAGMSPRRGLWRRPFLGLRRDQTEAVCRSAGVEVVLDPSNDPEGPWRAADGSPLRRAAVRARALPALTESLGPGVPEALARTAEHLRRDADLLDDLAEELLRRATTAIPAERPAVEATGDPSPVSLDVGVLAAAHPALRTRAMHRAALLAGAVAGALGSRHIGMVEALVTSYHGQGPVMLPGGVEGHRECGRLILVRRPDRRGGRSSG